MTLVIAHRGANQQAAENTLGAFSGALALGADGVELDVHRTIDNVLVVRHDADGPAGTLAEMTATEVHAALPHVPTLGDALALCAGHLVNVEIKNSPGQSGFDPTERVSDLVVALLATRGGNDDVLVSSFSLASIDRVRALEPTIPTALLTFGGDALQVVDVAESHGHVAIHPFAGLLAGSAARTVIAHAHERGLQVNVWTVNDPVEMVRLADQGVDAIITDVPDIALDALRG